MVQTFSAKDISLEELERFFNLQLVEDEDFFREWQDDLPEITDLQKQLLDQVKAGYFNLIKKTPFLEKPINITIVSPILFIGEFYLAPFYIKAETSIEITAEDEGVIVKGNLDTLVLKDQIWLMIIESKRVTFSIEAGLAQIIAYMLANPNPTQPRFGMITTGSTFIFIKLIPGNPARYATSNLLAIRNRGNELYSVLRILKRLIQLAE
ncbi:restriction endonuclease subunit R [Floridanema evergladense]|uniref:Restriction endonuclease subunit R n=1 Tax=Floridaenema evergladense BLCC-F167 TaxID=3153639 RepID=A0ABV4WSG9_9CYAN